MRTVTIVHPDLGRTVEVPTSTAAVLARSGWVRPEDLVPRKRARPARRPATTTSPTTGTTSLPRRTT